MEVYLISDNKKYLAYWSEAIQDSKLINTDELDVLRPNDILVIDNDCFDKKMNTKAKIMVLDAKPNFEVCMNLFKYGIKAYGNIYMHKSHILSALESLKDNKIWMYPDFAAMMIFKINESNSVSDDKISDLTKREKEIVNLIMNGLTNKEIATHLSISANTVKVHTKNIYEKLNVSDRLSLFSYLR